MPQKKGRKKNKEKKREDINNFFFPFSLYKGSESKEKKNISQ